MRKIITIVFAILFGMVISQSKIVAQQVAPTTSDSVPTVYVIKDITPKNLIKIYDALDRRATGRVCVKLST